MLASPDDARRAVLAFIDRPDDPWPLARALYRFQRAHVPAYERFAAGAEPTCLEEIPAVPVAIFRDVRFCAGRPGAVFRTSGTTTGRRGEHAMIDTRVYDRGARAWFDACAPGCPVGNTVSLVTPPARHPDSSLGHMVASFAPGARWYFDPDRGLDAAGAWDDLERADAPVFLPATAFALAALLEDSRRSAALPEGSAVMITGGFKGRRTRLDAAALRAALPERLGPGVALLGEYGMTELSSQLWEVDDSGYRPPPWLHVYAVDPLSGAPVEGEGLLRFVDLANWSSALAIETMDLGAVERRPGGDRVRLSGRLSGAPPRGCSLTVEEVTWTG